MGKFIGYILLFIGFTIPKIECQTPCYTDAYTGYSQSGFYYTFQAYVSDLSSIDFDDAICSVKQTGMWIYYQNTDYNKLSSGQVYWVHGVDISVNFPTATCGVTSSLKYAGNRHVLNEDSYTIYSGEYYTGDEFYGNVDSPDLSILNNAGSSIILTGLSHWTFYTGSSYTGYAFCFYPDTDEDTGSDGTVLNFGFFGSLQSINVPDDSFRSVRKGCYSDVIVRAPQMEAEQRFKNGAWGIVQLQN